MRNPKVVFLVSITLSAGAAWAAQQQAPAESAAANTPAAAAPMSTNATNEADQTAALIAKANAAAAANANARAAMSTRTLTRAEASRAARKKASEFGFRAEVYNGNTLFCKHDAALGSRIPLVRCMSEYEFEEYATQMKIARDSLESNLETQCQGKLTCGGIKMGQTGNASN